MLLQAMKKKLILQTIDLLLKRLCDDI